MNAKVVDIAEQRAGKARAPACAGKLEAARASLRGLKSEVGPARLAADEGAAPTSAKELNDLRARIADTEREVLELEEALKLALRLDQRAEFAARAKTRSQQLIAFQKHGSERVAAVRELCDASAAMAAAYQRYGIATRLMAGVLPSGTSMPPMALGPDGVLESAVGGLERLLSAELYRCSEADADGQRFVVPFGKPPTLNSTDPAKCPPCAEIFAEAQQAIVTEIRGQLARMEAAEVASIEEQLKAAI